MSGLAARGIAKSYPGAGQPVLRDVALEIARGRTLAILGRSGCGKTTLLKILAGLLAADAGEVRLEGADITRLPPQRRNVVYLFQEPLLFPHLDVFENVAFGLRLRRQPAAAVEAAVDAMLEELELAGEGRRLPHQLSGGQRQRVAFGRALVVRPALLLLDEPFSSLDAETRGAMQQLFKRIAQAHATTALFVTHSLKEAMLMGHSLAHLGGGTLREYASIEELVRDPASGVAEEVRFWRSLGSLEDHGTE